MAGYKNVNASSFKTEYIFNMFLESATETVQCPLILSKDFMTSYGGFVVLFCFFVFKDKIKST